MKLCGVMSNRNPENVTDGPVTDQTADPPSDHSIRTKNLHLTYDDGTEAIKDISMSVPRGAFFGFLGPNGAGKTSLIKILVTLLRPTKGDVEVNGFSLEENPQAIRESIGYMAQETSIDGELTARENLRFACQSYGVPKTTREDRITELLDLVGLSEVADKEARGFSGGMKKRLDAATALVHEPPLIFLDEPTTGLDPKSRNKLWQYFEDINIRGQTIFLTTQYLEEANRLCDSLSVIQGGEIIASGMPADLKKRVGGYVLTVEFGKEEEAKRAAEIIRNAEVFEEMDEIGRNGTEISIASPTIQNRGVDFLAILRESSLSISSFDLHEPTLDDVFLTLTGETADQKIDEGPEVQ